MNSGKFTRKTIEAVDTAHDLAVKAKHPRLNPFHLAAALISDSAGIFSQVVSIVAGENAAQSVERVIYQALKEPPSQSPPAPPCKSLIKVIRCAQSMHNAVQREINRVLKKLPSQSPLSYDIPVSKSLIKVIRHAQAAQKACGDSHLAISKLIISLLEDHCISDLLKEAEVSPAQVKFELESLKFCRRDLVKQVRKLDPIAGRDEDVRRVIRILSSRTKNNPILIGESEVVKTAIVESLAQAIVRGDVPSNLSEVKLIAVDMGALVTRDKYQGKINERLNALLKEVEEVEGEVILFIDNIHLVLGVGRIEESTTYSANLFKSTLAKGQLRCIGATTLEEFQKHVEEDATFERSFEQVHVAEPGVADTIGILRWLKEKYEGHHGVLIQDQALVVAAQQSARYITGQPLPDKAIDLVDEACANQTVQLDSPSKGIHNLENKQMQLEIKLLALDKEKDEVSKAQLVKVRKELNDIRDKLGPLPTKHKKVERRIKEIRPLKQTREDLLFGLQDAGRRYDLQTAADLRYGAIQEVESAISQLETNSKKNLKIMETVGPQHIAEFVSQSTGIPMTMFGQNEKERLINRLRQRIVGQDQAVNIVVEAILRSRGGLERPQKPTGSFLFLGSSGIGKTELAKALAEKLFGDDNMLIRINMSAYMEQDSIVELIGTPPGYVGHEEVGELTGAVRRWPKSVVVFDGVEKAHVTVLDTLLQVLNDGRLTDGQGRTVNFRNTVIIMTSSLGAEHLLSGLKGKLSMQDARDRMMQEVRKHFRPKLLEGLDEIVMFDPLDLDKLREVARLEMKDIVARLASKGIAMTITDAALDCILVEKYDPADGAWLIRRLIEKKVVNEIAEMLILDKIDEKSTVCIDVGPKGSDLVYRVEKRRMTVL